MGTNYYMSTKDKSKRDKWLNFDEYHLTDEPDWGYEVHIGKVSCGWKPLFQAHDRLNSLALYKLMYDEGGWSLYDEYRQVLSWEDFKDIIDSFTDGKPRRSVIDYSYEPHTIFYDHEGNEFMRGDFC